MEPLADEVQRLSVIVPDELAEAAREMARVYQVGVSAVLRDGLTAHLWRHQLDVTLAQLSDDLEPEVLAAERKRAERALERLYRNAWTRPDASSIPPPPTTKDAMTSRADVRRPTARRLPPHAGPPGASLAGAIRARDAEDTS